MSKDQLLKIRQLIEEKQYDAARKQLLRLSDMGDPTAKKWLAKLNEIAPPAAKSTATVYNANRYQQIEAEKKQRREAARQETAKRWRIGCALRGCLATVMLGMICFLILPMLLAMGITSQNEQAQAVTEQVFTFVEEQQENPVGRALTTTYTQTSGEAMQRVILPRDDQICDIAIERAANNGRTVSRTECIDTVNEAITCVSDEFTEAKTCLRRYLYNRCIEQVGNTAEGQAHCEAVVEQNLGS